jgi:hypothetical protein
MIFSIALIISELSAGLTLEPGDASHPARLTVSAFTAGPPMHWLPDVVEVEDRVNWHTAQSRRRRRESHRLASRLARQRPDLYH